MSDFENWDISDLYNAIKNLDGNVKKKKLEIPKFQRFKCWNNPEAESLLIDSIQSNFPIGALTFYKVSSDIVTKYFILDGLQRTLTILKYFDNPISFLINSTRLKSYSKDLNKKYKKKFTNNKEGLQTIFDEWFSVNNLGNYEAITKKNYSNIAGNENLKRIIKRELGSKCRDLYDEILTMTNKFSEEIIINYRVPIMICYCAENKLCDVFARLNTAGVKLQEYEICAATWSNKIIDIENNNIKNGISKYYEKLSDGYKINNVMCIELSNNNNNLSNNNYNCCEYLFGLKTYIDTLFGQRIKNINGGNMFDMDFIFKMTSLMLTKTFNPSDIPEHLINLQKSGNIHNFENKIIQSIDFAIDTFNYFFVLKNINISGSDSGLTLVSIACTCYNNFDLIESNKSFYIELFSLHQLVLKIKWKIGSNSTAALKNTTVTYSNNHYFMKLIEKNTIFNSYSKYINKTKENYKGIKCTPKLNMLDEIILLLINKKKNIVNLIDVSFQQIIDIKTIKMFNVIIRKANRSDLIVHNSISNFYLGIKFPIDLACPLSDYSNSILNLANDILYPVSIVTLKSVYDKFILCIDKPNMINAAISDYNDIVNKKYEYILTELFELYKNCFGI